MVCVSLLSLSGCGGGPLSLLTGGGPNVAANTQIGAENNQALISVRPQARPTVTLERDAKVDKIEQNTTNNTELNPWLILLLILGWMAPSPGEIARGIRNLWRKTPD